MDKATEMELARERLVRAGRGAIAAATVLLAAACGGGKDGASDTGGDAPNAPAAPAAPAAPVDAPSKAEASRFLAQATMGPSAADIDHLAGMSYAAWFEEQFAKPQTLHRITMNQATADAAAVGQEVSEVNFFNSWWSQALGADDQLRQRAAFALSEIFVISFSNATLQQQPRGVASYYDMLGEKSFGNFRDLLEGVTYHPMMGVFLSHLKNQKEDPATGRVPDLNFAREITQLFSIGQYKLNLDGTTVPGRNGQPALAYSPADLEGLSQVFTGLSWYAGPALTDRTSARFFGGNANVERDWRPMQDYNEYTPNTSFHSISAKTFWGVTIAPQTIPDTVGDVKVALDTLFHNPNVGPFIGKQLIQRLVSSNPSPAYVARVAAAFDNNGSGVRGDMKAVWKAILLDPEARAVGTSSSSGKLREPVLRLSHMLRAFNATSRSGRFTGIGLTDDPATRLNQTPMFAPSVFNFFRPGYVPSGQGLAQAGLVVPEMQITHELSVAGYMNYMRTWTQIDRNRDIQHDYAAEIALATTPADLVERMNLLLFGGTMPDALRTQITSAVASRAIPAPAFPPGRSAGERAGADADQPDADRRRQARSRLHRGLPVDGRARLPDPALDRAPPCPTSTLRGASSCAPLRSSPARWAPPARRSRSTSRASARRSARPCPTTRRSSASFSTAATIRRTRCCAPTRHRSASTRACARPGPTRSRCSRRERRRTPARTAPRRPGSAACCRSSPSSPSRRRTRRSLTRCIRACPRSQACSRRGGWRCSPTPGRWSCRSPAPTTPRTRSRGRARSARTTTSSRRGRRSAPRE